MKHTAVIHMYNPTTDSLDIIGHMRIPILQCIAAVLPENPLMVAGGRTDEGDTNTVEFAIVQRIIYSVCMLMWSRTDW